MKTATEYGDIARKPGVYAMYGGLPPRTWVAYVGLGTNVQRRLVQHFDKRDSSVVTGVSAVALNVDAVAYVDWWEHDRFSEKASLHAAELIAFEVLDPALRSRGSTPQDATTLADDPAFRPEMEELFRGTPAGRYTPPNLSTLARHMADLVERVERIEAQLRADQ